MVTNYDGGDIEFKDSMPLLPIRDIVVYPFMILPLFVGRDASIQAVEASLGNFDRLILLSSQKDITDESPHPDEIYLTGTVAMIMRMRKLPDGRLKILVQGLSKAKITNFEQEAPYFKVKLEKVVEPVTQHDEVETNALMRNIKEQLEKLISLGKVLSSDILMVLEDIHEPGRLADLISSNLNLHVSEAQMILETMDPIDRLHKINDIISRELEIISMQNKIKGSSQSGSDIDQKEYFLREQIKAIKNELGDESGDPEDEFKEIKNKVIAAQMTQEAEKESLKQLSRLEKMHPDSSESAIIRNYLEWMVELPWNKESKEQAMIAKREANNNVEKLHVKILKLYLHPKFEI